MTLHLQKLQENNRCIKIEGRCTECNTSVYREYLEKDEENSYITFEIKAMNTCGFTHVQKAAPRFKKKSSSNRTDKCKSIKILSRCYGCNNGLR